MAAKALSFRPSMTLPKWHTSIDMRMPPVASRRMYRHSATMHSHSTPMERSANGKGMEMRTVGGEKAYMKCGGVKLSERWKELKDGGG